MLRFVSLNLAIILKNTPAVLSLGKLVDQEGFDYIWRTTTTPFLQKGTIKVLCYPTHDVPFIASSIEKEETDHHSDAGINSLPPLQEALGNDESNRQVK